MIPHNMRHVIDYLIGLIGIVVAVALVGWGFYGMLKRSDDPWKMLFKWLFTVPFVFFSIKFAHDLGPFGPFLIVAMAVVLSIMWTPHIAEWAFSPLTDLFDGGSVPPEKKPFYSIAKTKRKRGLYAEAVEEVRKQLAKFPNDFEGIMLLASVQAEDLKDLPAAENTLNQYCASTDAPDNFVAVAWTTMADWYLKIGLDVDGARGSLEKIITLFPETEMALHAEQRLAHLTETESMLLGASARKTVILPVGPKNLGLMNSMAHIKPKEIEPGRLAAAHVKHLESHPNDSEVREKLATIYARDFKRLDLATMELVQIINEPRHSPKQVAGWLNLLANFQIELGADVDTVRSTLETILARFPELPIADITRRRLERLNSEFKGLEKNEGIKLGTYEQNIGLKYGRTGSGRSTGE